MSDWKDEAVGSLIQICKGEGISQFRQEEVDFVLGVLAKRDVLRPKKLRLGFAYLFEQEGATKTKFFQLVSKNWNNTRETLMTQVPLQSKPEGSIHTHECVISLKLDRDNYEPITLLPIFKNYLIESIEPPFDCLVVNVARVFGSWYDLQLRYSCNLIDAYKILTRIPWVKDGVARPISDFGKRTLALPE